MILRALNFIKRPTSKDVIINTFGNYLTLVFTAFFALILVRILNPSQYGVLSVLLGIAYVLANILDFGTTATIYSYLPPLYEKKSFELYRFIKSTVFFQSLFSFIVIAVLVIFFPFLDRVFFKTGAPVWELYLTAISVLFFIWQNSISNILFAAKKFLKANIYLNISNLIRAVLLIALVYLHQVSVGSVIFVFGIVGPLVFFLIILWDKKELVPHFLASEIKKEDFRFGYTLTYFLASQFFNLGMRMDLFLLSYFLTDRAQVGYYGLSQKIILTVITTAISITQVLSPAYTKITSKKEAFANIKTSFLYLLLPTGLFIVLFLLPKKVYEIFFTSEFVQTAPITRALSLPFILYALGTIPMLFILYTIKKPIYILVTNIMFFVVLTGFCYILIPSMGVFGPPYAILAAMGITVGIQSLLTVIEYQKLPSGNLARSKSKPRR